MRKARRGALTIPLAAAGFLALVTAVRAALAEITVPAGAIISVRVIEGIDSARCRSGDEFPGSVDSPVSVAGRVVVPRGADASIRYLQQGKTARLELVELSFGGNTYRVSATTTSPGTTGENVRVPSDSRIEFKLTQPLTVG